MFARFNIQSTPFLLFLNPDGTALDWIAGYKGGPEAFHRSILDLLAGKETVASLEALTAREPANPEPVIKLAGKYQKRNDRDKALELSLKARDLSAKSGRTMRLENGATVSCSEMAEYQYARTFMVTFGLMNHQPLRKFIDSHPESPLAREAYLDLGRMFSCPTQGCRSAKSLNVA